jgi:hypothetical protein
MTMFGRRGSAGGVFWVWLGAEHLVASSAAATARDLGAFK